MNLSNRLKTERLAHDYSRLSLKNMLKKSANLDITTTSIRNWEEGISSINPESLVAISNLYDISIDDLIDENAEPKINMNEEYIKIGKSIHNYCNVTDITSFLQTFQIFDKAKWIPSPKYDLIVRLYSFDLSSFHINVFKYKYVFEICDLWISQLYKQSSNINNIDIEHNFYQDPAGHLSPDDKREPVDLIEIIKEIYCLKKDLSFLLETYDFNGVETNSWDYL